MNEVIINGLFGLCGTFLGSVVSIVTLVLSYKKDKTMLKRERSLKTMITNLNGFHHLEEEYIKKLIELRKEKGETSFVTHDAIVKEMRKKLRENEIDFDFKPSDINQYKKDFYLL